MIIVRLIIGMVIVLYTNSFYYSMESLALTLDLFRRVCASLIKTLLENVY